MWKTLHKQLNIFHKTLSVKEYCLEFLKLINPNEEIWGIDELESYLKINPTLDFFPEIINLNNYFNNGNYRFVANYIYHFPDTDKSWFDIDNNWVIKDVQKQYQILFDDTSEFYLFKKTIFDPEHLLSQDDLNRQLTFLFLLFLPSIENYGLFYHPFKKIPLICCNLISNKNFDMLFDLMHEYDSFELNILCSGRNLNHILMEDFMNNSSALYSFDPEINWSSILPIYKIHKLLDINCNFQLFSNYISRNSAYMFEDMPELLIKLEREYMYFKFNEQLAKKDGKKEEILKL